ncbi:MAG: hypothetical protein BEN18_06990 [Epulopiscium sp. Nuni2H_MBin001]|nr:MAG: hypothetical protein BEN18_06990 [Epulopiscium sp. Nuni2H_MBin001]
MVIVDERDYIFYGKHAKMVRALSTYFDVQNKYRFFENDLQIYILAPIVGVLYNRVAPISKDDAMMVAIALQDLNAQKVQIAYNFKLIMLVIDKESLCSKERVDRAFSGYYDPVQKGVMVERYNEYVRGGVEVLHEKLIVNSDGDYMQSLYKFLFELNNRYYKELSSEEIVAMAMSYDY